MSLHRSTCVPSCQLFGDRPERTRKPSSSSSLTLAFRILRNSSAASDGGLRARPIKDAFGKRFAPHVVAIEREQIESACHRDVIIGATVQGVKIRHPVFARADYLSVENARALQSRRLRSNERIAIGPIGHHSSCTDARDHREHGSEADSRRARVHAPTHGRLATVGRQRWMKAAGAFLGRPRELRSRHNLGRI
jgi:hypothetical protein